MTERELQRTAERVTRGALMVGLVAIASGCAKRAPTLLKERAADLAAIDGAIASANALVAKVPERGTHAFPRCKATSGYAFNTMGGVHNTDLVGAKLLAGYPSPLQDILELRAKNADKSRWNGTKVYPPDEQKIDAIRDLKFLLVIREHKDASDDHVSADMFVVSRSPSAIVCAFGFEGGARSFGSAGTVVGKEVISVKKTGKVVAERDVVQGAYSGSSGAFNARNHLPESVARNLGMSISYNTAEAAERARRAVPTGLGEYPSIKVRAVLEDRGAVAFRSSISQPFGTWTSWDTDGVHVSVFETERASGVIGAEQALIVSGADGQALATRLLATPIPTPKDLVARLRPLGFVATGPVKEERPDAGFRRYALRAKRGSYEATFSVLDFSEAAHRRGGAAMRVEGKKLLIVQGTSPVLGTAEEIAAEIVGK